MKYIYIYPNDLEQLLDAKYQKPHTKLDIQYSNILLTHYGGIKMGNLVREVILFVIS